MTECFAIQRKIDIVSTTGRNYYMETIAIVQTAEKAVDFCKELLTGSIYTSDNLYIVWQRMGSLYREMDNPDTCLWSSYLQNNK